LETKKFHLQEQFPALGFRVFDAGHLVHADTGIIQLLKALLKLLRGLFKQ